MTKVLWRNMFCSNSFNIPFFQLSNACNIILIYILGGMMIVFAEAKQQGDFAPHEDKDPQDASMWHKSEVDVVSFVASATSWLDHHYSYRWWGKKKGLESEGERVEGGVLRRRRERENGVKVRMRSWEGNFFF